MDLTADVQLLHDCKLLSIEQEEIDLIEEKTRCQSSSPVWFAERVKRLTASNFGRLSKLTPFTNRGKLAREMMSGRLVTSSSLGHGLRYEPVAIFEYSKRFKTSVQKVGFFVDKDRPYLGCSPDGFAGDQLLIEVKCPYVAKDRHISPMTVPYLYQANGTLKLKLNHDYMYQVQGQMHITGRKKCHLVIFTVIDLQVVVIDFDKAFVEEMLMKLDTYFHETFKQEFLRLRLFKDSHLLH